MSGFGNMVCLYHAYVAMSGSYLSTYRDSGGWDADTVDMQIDD